MTEPTKGLMKSSWATVREWWNKLFLNKYNNVSFGRVVIIGTVLYSAWFWWVTGMMSAYFWPGIIIGVVSILIEMAIGYEPPPAAFVEQGRSEVK